MTKSLSASQKKDELIDWRKPIKATDHDGYSFPCGGAPEDATQQNIWHLMD